MNVRELREALAALGPEYDESMVVVFEPGMGLQPGEATRLITVPKIENIDHRYSYEIFERVVMIDAGGQQVSKNAEQEGWKVPYYNPTRRDPSPLTRTPRQQYEDFLKTEEAKRHVACEACFVNWQKERCVPSALVRFTSGKKEYCCHCGKFSPPAALTKLGKEYCEGLHGKPSYENED